MDTNKLKMLLKAVELKSMSKAAEEFSYTPSAFSHIADSVEKELGVKILKRTHVGTELTEEGALIIDKIKKLVNAENELLATANDMLSDKTVVHIGTYSSISKFILPKLIKRFKAKNSEIGVSIVVRESVKNLLEQGVVDIILADDTEKTDAKTIKLFEDRFVAVFPESENKFNGSVTKDDLYGFTFILPLESRIKRYLDLNKFKEVIEIKSDDDSPILQMVKEELGVTVLSTLELKNQIKGIKTLVLEPELKRNISLMYLENNKKSKTIKEFIAYMLQECQTLEKD